MNAVGQIIQWEWLTGIKVRQDGQAVLRVVPSTELKFSIQANKTQEQPWSSFQSLQ